MKCSVCHQPIIIVEHDGIELDYCTGCAGVWFDAGEVELLLDKLGLESAGLEGLHLSAEVKTPEARRRCPVCGRRMKKVTVGEESRLVIDACPDGDGLWFDGGEVGRLVRYLAGQQATSGDVQEQVVRFLGEVIRLPGRTGQENAS